MATSDNFNAILLYTALNSLSSPLENIPWNVNMTVIPPTNVGTIHILSSTYNSEREINIGNATFLITTTNLKESVSKFSINLPPGQTFLSGFVNGSVNGDIMSFVTGSLYIVDNELIMSLPLHFNSTYTFTLQVKTSSQPVNSLPPISGGGISDVIITNYNIVTTPNPPSILISDLVAGVIKYRPKKILWTIPGPLCSSVSATPEEHMTAISQIMDSYKNSGIPLPYITSYPTMYAPCWSTNENITNTALYTLVAADLANRWDPVISTLDPEYQSYVFKECCFDPEDTTLHVVDWQTTLGPLRAALPSNVAISLITGYTAIGDPTQMLGIITPVSNEFAQGNIYMEIYNLVGNLISDVTPDNASYNGFSPPRGQSIYGNPSQLTPIDAANRCWDIIQSKISMFPYAPSSPPLNNFIFVFSYELLVFAGTETYLMGNSNPAPGFEIWSRDNLTLFINQFASNVMSGIKPTPQRTSIVFGIYGAGSAFNIWDS